MIHEDKSGRSAPEILSHHIQIVRHNQVCQRLQISSAKLFDMVAKKQFPKPFTLIPGGRAVGWISQDVDNWILERKNGATKGAV